MTSIVVKVVVTICFMFVMNKDRSSRSYRETLDVQGNCLDHSPCYSFSCIFVNNTLLCASTNDLQVKVCRGPCVY